MEDKSLLLVDDEQIILDSLGRDLELHDIKVTKATSGEEAIIWLNSSPFDFVITDLIMEGLDGFQVLKEAKKQHPEICVIILTGYGDMVSAIDALRLGADDFLQKPCDSDELLYRLSNCLTKQELQRKVTIYESILPICMYCKKIRDDRGKKRGQGDWFHMEDYFRRISSIDFSYGCCPQCYTRVMRNDDELL